MLAGFGKFLRGYDDLSATASAAFFCGLQTGTCSFPDQIALELRQRAEQVEDQATAGCRGVDVFGDGSEADAFGLQFGDDLDEVLHRPAEAVELPDCERIAVPNVADRLRQSGPVSFHAGCLILEQPFATCFAQSVELQGGVLLAGGDSCIADRGYETWFVRFAVL
jgi:hypothetical protein